MAYQALYRKYRPATFSQVVGQEHIIETLKNELSSGKTVHAYLFTGTRGTGKTSCAKILAKAVNCLHPNGGDPCLACEACRMIADDESTDIVEIDAASNNSVDSIRELRDQVNFTPSAAKYRVYIIDEVHMLSVSAFNALLKTLEEPPAHVIFILATTEVHKLPATILSRCQRFDFRRIEPEKIKERIKAVCAAEELSISEDAAELIAAAADGGMRDALSILDLCASSGGEITEETVLSVCSMAGDQYLSELSEYLRAGDCENALLCIDRLHNASVDMQRLTSELISHYRNLLILKTVKNGRVPIVCSAARLREIKAQAEDYPLADIMRTLRVLQETLSAMQTGDKRCEVEMAVVQLCRPEAQQDFASLEKRIRALETGIARAPAAGAVSARAEESGCETPEDSRAPESDTISSDEPESEQAEAPVPPGKVEEWQDVLRLLRTECPPIAGVLDGSSAYIKGDFLLIDAPNRMFRSMINSESQGYRDAIRSAAHSVLGKIYKLGPYTPAEPAREESDPLPAFAESLKKFQFEEKQP